MDLNRTVTFAIRKRTMLVCAVVVICVAIGYRLFKRYYKPASPPRVFQTSWQTTEGFVVSEYGGRLFGPVAIANLKSVVPRSGFEFLVTEMRGLIRAIDARGRIVDIAKQRDVYKADRVLPDGEGAYGLHGICVSPQGRDFYTTSVLALDGKLVNKITRWRFDPDSPTLNARVVSELLEPFRNGQAFGGHSIGNCTFGPDGKLYVGIGDGHMWLGSHDPQVAAGKILRINQDLSAPTDNPFYDAKLVGSIQNFVFASGFRNPWAICFGRNGDMYVADNGPSVDRLIRVRPGEDFPWDGTDDSMGLGALLVWPRAIGPVALAFVDDRFPIESLRNSLVVTGTAVSAVMQIPLTETGIVARKPRVLVGRPRADYENESVNGLVLASDAIFVAHMQYDQDDFFKATKLLRIAKGTATTASFTEDGSTLIRSVGCLGCHSLGNEGSLQAPRLDGVGARVLTRLEDPEYMNKIENRGSSVALLLSGSPDERVASWIAAKLRDPTFDHSSSQMPRLKLEEEKIVSIAKYLSQYRVVEQ